VEEAENPQAKYPAGDGIDVRGDPASSRLKYIAQLSGGLPQPFRTSDTASRTWQGVMAALFALWDSHLITLPTFRVRPGRTTDRVRATALYGWGGERPAPVILGVVGTKNRSPGITSFHLWGLALVAGLPAGNVAGLKTYSTGRVTSLTWGNLGKSCLAEG